MPYVAAVAAVVAAVGAVVSTVAQIKQANEQAAVADAESKFRFQEAESAAQAREREAEMQKQEAETTRQSAVFEEQQFRRRIAAHLASGSAIAAASGVVPSSGSPMLQELENTRQAEIEALNIRRTGVISSSGLEFESRLRQFEAGTIRTRGAFESSALRFQAGSLRSGIPLIAAGGALKAGGSILSAWSGTGVTTNKPLSSGRYSWQG